MVKEIESLSLGDIIEKTFSKGSVDEFSILRKESEIKKVFIENFFHALMLEVSSGKRVRIKNVGVFSHRLTKEEVRNPANNEMVYVSKRKRLRFEPSTSTINILNEV